MKHRGNTVDGKCSTLIAQIGQRIAQTLQAIWAATGEANPSILCLIQQILRLTGGFLIAAASPCSIETASGISSSSTKASPNGPHGFDFWLAFGGKYRMSRCALGNGLRPFGQSSQLDVYPGKNLFGGVIDFQRIMLNGINQATLPSTRMSAAEGLHRPD